MYTLCGTGHRPDKLGSHWNPIGFRPAIRAVQHLISDMSTTETGGITVISGMALGFDMILAVAAIQAREAGNPIRLVAAVPFEGHHARWTDRTARLWYQQILEDADEQQIVCPGPYAAWKLKQRNRWMVDRSQHVLACWSGAPGGTANCLAYARSRRPPIAITNIFDTLTPLF